MGMDDSSQRDPAAGVCVSCGARGEVGRPCGEPVCARGGYRFVPREYASSEAGADRDSLIGDTIGDYLVVDVIGAGGFGRVYLGLQLPILMRAAIKLLALDKLPDKLVGAMREKFEGEARALALLQHPNIVRLLHYGTHCDQPYLVMDYVEGGVTLRDDIIDRAEQGRRFTLDELRDLFDQLLDGLAAAHERGIVHRDIKPDNLMLQQAVGHPRLLRILDFGLAKFLATGESTASTTGTPGYMAPEQLKQRSIGPWTDLYAVSTIAFELLTGRKPFPGETAQDVYLLKLHPLYDPTTRVDDLDLPDRVTAFLRRAMAHEHDARYRDAAGLRAGLYEALDALAARPGDPLAHVSLTDLLGPQRPGSGPTLDVKPFGASAPGAPGRLSDDAFRRWIDREGDRLEREAERLSSPVPEPPDDD
jgi:serine/threonine-protein kinase